MPRTQRSQAQKTPKREVSVVVARVAVALIVSGLAVPVTLTALFQSVDEQGILIEDIIDQRPRALQDRVRARLQRRQFWDAQYVYQDLLRKGINPESLTPPDVNDDATVQWYLDSENIKQFDASLPGGVHTAAPRAPKRPVIDDNPVHYDDLLESDRDTLDGYVATGFCPLSLKVTHKHIHGFYDLCLAKIQEQRDRDRETVFERSSYLRGWSQGRVSMYQSLKHRLQILEETLQGGSLRPKHEGRPPLRNAPVSD